MNTAVANPQVNSQILAAIVSSYDGASMGTVLELIEKTNEVSGCRFVSIMGYNSDKSDHTEIANHVVNVGFVYENMKIKHVDKLREINFNRISVDDFDYDSITIPETMTLSQFKERVHNQLHTAYSELVTSAVTVPGQSGRQSNDVWLNKVLVFNTHSNRLSIIGEKIKKNVTQRGVFRRPKSSPKTVAKQIIQSHLGMDTYRRFKIANLHSVKINGDTVVVE